MRSEVQHLQRIGRTQDEHGQHAVIHPAIVSDRIGAGFRTGYGNVMMGGRQTVEPLAGIQVNAYHRQELHVMRIGGGIFAFGRIGYRYILAG